MKYKEYVLEDFLADKNFINWVTNPSAASEKYWQGVLHSYPEKRGEIDEAIKLLKSIHFREVPVSEQQKDRILRNTIALKYSDRSKHLKSSKKRISNFKFIQIAAIIFLFISTAAFLAFQFSESRGLLSSSSSDEIEMITKQNRAGRKSRIHLPDGSQVILNANSKIQYYSNFLEKRSVWLTGEASFDVKENLGTKFLVLTENLNITVKGTTFNVSAFSDEVHESISLLSGKVNVTCSNNFISEEHDLIPGEKLTVDLSLNKLTVSDLVMEDVIWSSGILVFKNDDIETFIKKIQRWYGVSVEVSGIPKDMININGKFDNESLENVLESLKFSVGINYQLKNKKVEIQL